MTQSHSGAMKINSHSQIWTHVTHSRSNYYHVTSYNAKWNDTMVAPLFYSVKPYKAKWNDTVVALLFYSVLFSAISPVDCFVPDQFRTQNILSFWKLLYIIFLYKKFNCYLWWLIYAIGASARRRIGALARRRVGALARRRVGASAPLRPLYNRTVTCPTINVKQRKARLVLGWVTHYGLHRPLGCTICVNS